MEGSLYQILEFKDGMGKNGHWQKQSFVVKTFNPNPKFIACVCWGGDVAMIQKLHINDQIKFDIEISSREYNNRWYTDVTASNVELLPNESPFLNVPEALKKEEPKPTHNDKLFSPDEGLNLPF